MRWEVVEVALLEREKNLKGTAWPRICDVIVIRRGRKSSKEEGEQEFSCPFEYYIERLQISKKQDKGYTQSSQCNVQRGERREHLAPVCAIHTPCSSGGGRNLF